MRLKEQGRTASSEASSALHLACACAAIALGGALLGLQVDGRGQLVGTGYMALAFGGLVALLATALETTNRSGMPRDWISALSAVAGFLGIAFIVSGVLAPGGGWMFAEAFLLAWMLARRARPGRAGPPELSIGVLLALAVMLLFRLWITYQGSEHRWQLGSIPVPFLSALPFSVLEPIQRVELGSFRPQAMGFPATGIDFALSVVLWSAGFSLCAAGLWWRATAAREHENDRIHATICTLPTGAAALVEMLLPEPEWEALGLHGLNERMRQKRISALVRERLMHRAQFNEALREAGDHLAAWSRALEGQPFAGEVRSALGGYALPAGPTLSNREDTNPERELA
jgi:hypothetical protein